MASLVVFLAAVYDLVLTLLASEILTFPVRLIAGNLTFDFLNQVLP